MYAWQSAPGTVRVLDPRTTGAANTALTFTQPFDPTLDLVLEVRGPGRMRVLVNGKDVSERINPSVITADGLLSFWEYQSSSLESPLVTATTEATPRKGTPLTVTVVPQDFKGADWRISVVRRPPNG
jgi:hypothetical protein